MTSADEPPHDRTARLMPDPLGHAGGILTAGELEACLRVLAVLSKPVSATVLLTWSEPDQRAWVVLSRAGYVVTHWRRDGALFQWNRIFTTSAGLRWAEQIREAGTRA